MAGTFTVINLESGRPTVRQAHGRLIGALTRARDDGFYAAKVIHGYGSSGPGGALRVAVRQWLARLKSDGEVRAFVPGESFSIFDPTSRLILDACRELKADPDLSRGNNGITLVLL